ncbi:MAG: lipase secretion chaperone [Gammaproteobacteria bacterium]|nr:lipase secretion chaperone [Rhodoferax sp.]MBU3898012.1 lipase secretion chaperone [Gammaproteobacteria bacterium]MBU3995961.1 lipase secretion chaperone [Gammaproteobacteria bacterium]MBU4078979.1 lipase secretion chaperone [Gammaproteobacteria bacterium]MBU4113666.1 lipase secretion chaperone [Gammaproteobacteria bacterium]
MKLPAPRLVWGSAALALAAAAWFWWPHAVTTTRQAAPALAPGAAGAPFVHSMQDTVPDGNLRALPGAGPALAIGPLPYAELKRLFDYYLSAVGEQTIEAITQEIAGDLDRRLAPDQLPAAKRLLALYLQFKLALVDLEKKPELAGTDVKAVRQRLLAMQDLRSQFFSAEETQGMFGFEDDYDQDAVARLEVSQNPALSAKQKAEQLAALDASQSAVLREEREAPRVVLKLEEMAQTLRAQGASEDDIYRMRSKEMNPEAAARLAEVDREESAWKSRIASYLNERSKLLQAQADAPPAQREEALSQLQQSQFSPDERRRLAAYEP